MVKRDALLLLIALSAIACAGSKAAREDADGDGFTADDGDCDDNAAALNPNAEEVCDGIDNDCDGEIDVGASDMLPWYADADLDGFGSMVEDDVVMACEQPDGFVETATDCDDEDPAVSPDGTEVCGDDVDNDCLDGDELCMTTLTLGTADAKFYGSAGERVGLSVGPAGDVDADGYDDLLVGSGTDTAHLVLGPVMEPLGDAKAISSSAVASFSGMGLGASTAGDVNGDGYADLLLASPQTSWTDDDGNVFNEAGVGWLVLGTPQEDWADPDRFSSADLRTMVELRGEVRYDGAGTSVASGDVNGDGKSDLFISAPYQDAGGSINDDYGAVYVFKGPVVTDLDVLEEMEAVNLDQATAKLIGESELDYAGISVADAGDVNGDGRHDIIVGAYHNDAGGDNAGAAYVVNGPVGGDLPMGDIGYKFVGERDGDYAGVSVDGAGDVNGDGYDDVLIGAYREDSGGDHTEGGDTTNAGASGAVYVVYGPFARTAELSDANAKLIGERFGDYAGVSVAGPGDVDGDGNADLLVGAYRNSTGAGAAYMVLGPVSGELELARSNLKMTGESGGDRAGVSVGGAGDVDGDGFADMLVGAYLVDQQTLIDAGAAYLVFGGSW